MIWVIIIICRIPWLVQAAWVLMARPSLHTILPVRTWARTHRPTIRLPALRRQRHRLALPSLKTACHLVLDPSQMLGMDIQ